MGGTPPGGGPGSITAGAATRRFRLASPATAAVLGTVALVLMALAIVLAGPVHQLSILGSGPVVPVVLIYVGVGVIVAGPDRTRIATVPPSPPSRSAR